GVEPRAGRRPDGRRREGARLRSCGARRSAENVQQERRRGGRRQRHGRARRRRRARDRHRVAGVPQPGLRGDQEDAQDAGDLRRPQPLRPGGPEGARHRLLPDRAAPVKRPNTARARVLVVGDVMLDRYWYGDALRISPEAPVPVHLYRSEEQRLGGAANVAANCAALGAQTRLLSVVGRDEAGRQLEKLLKKQKVDARLHRDAGVHTTQKLRIIARRQQLLRIDMEAPPSREILAAKLAEFRDAVRECDVVLLSDYGKGGLAHIETMIREGRKAKKPVLVDPKGDDYARYRGASLLTPNLAELREVVGQWKDEKDMAARAQALRENLRLDALLLTRGEDGMVLFRKTKITRVKAEKREVSDVTGAGDTVIATLAVMIAAGLGLEGAMRAANRAGGIKVTRFGTAVVTLDEIFG